MQINHSCEPFIRTETRNTFIHLSSIGLGRLRKLLRLMANTSHRKGAFTIGKTHRRMETAEKPAVPARHGPAWPTIGNCFHVLMQIQRWTGKGFRKKIHSARRKAWSNLQLRPWFMDCGSPLETVKANVSHMHHPKSGVAEQRASVQPRNQTRNQRLG